MKNFEQEFLKCEYHLFLLWETASQWREKIMRDLAEHFEIIESFKMCWPKDKFSENLTRFYSFQITKESENESVVGTGEFEIIIVKDQQPTYDDRMTAKQGVHYVNTNVFDLKTKYRNWTGKFRVHATNSADEFRHDLALLLGISDKEYFYGLYRQKSVFYYFGRQITGMTGWDSIQEVLFILNSCTDAKIVDLVIHDHSPYYLISAGNVLKTQLTLGMEPIDDVQFMISTKCGKVFFNFVEV